MAIAFARVSIHSRSQGRSAVAGAAYRSGQKLYDERTDETHNYENRQDVLYTEILLPAGADERYKHREFLWNAVEKCEKRQNSQIAKEVILALPRDISLEHHIALARNFAYQHFVSKGLVADVAIHNHDGSNPHAHIYITTRRLIGQEFDKRKARDLNPIFANAKGGKGFISEQDQWGEKWRDFQNEYFAQHNMDLMVDENLLISQRHQSRVRGDEQNYLKEENRIKRQASAHIVLNEPDTFVNILSMRYAVFSERQLANIIFKSTTTSEEFTIAMAKIKGHRDVICVGVSDKDGQLYYTTKINYRKETKLIEQAEILAKQSDHKAPSHLIKEVSARHCLSQEQQQALNHILKGQDIAIIVGHAGTGKSYLMKAAHEIWHKMGFRTQGITVSGVAARGLAEASNISSSTLATFKRHLANNKIELQKNDIVIMDEAGMTDLHDMAFVVDIVKQAHAKLVLIGDPNQLQPIGAGASFRALIETVGYIGLGDIRRQIDAGDREASYALAVGKTQEAFLHYKNKGAVHWHSTSPIAMENLIQRWSEALSTEALNNQLILSHRNSDIHQLNQLARQKLISQGFLSSQSQPIEVLKRSTTANGWQMTFIKEIIDLTSGDRILFRRNDKSLDIVNGDFATITSVEKEKITAKLDNGRHIVFNPTHYNEFDYGYAVTVHKAQGATFDKVFIYAGGQGWNRHLAYVALTRHRNSVELHIDQGNFSSEKILKSHFSREEIKDNVLDWPVNYARRRGFDEMSLINRFIERIGKLKENIKNAWYDIANKLSQQKRNTKNQKNINDIDWFSPKYRSEWESLRKINEKNIQWLVKFYDLSRTKKTFTDIAPIKKAINEISLKIAKNYKAFNLVKQQSPKLSEKIMFINKILNKSKVIEPKL